MVALPRGWSAQRLFIGALLLFFVGVSVQYSAKAAKGRSAINRWAPQIQQLETGEDIHRQYNYPNPPIMAILLWPVSELITYSPVVGALTWFYLKVGMAIFCMLAVFRMVESPERSFPAWAKALTVLLSIRPILGDLTHGNINIFILFLVIASLASFTRGRDVLAGILLALAVACKVTPALFIGYFLWKRAWRVLGGCGIGLVAFFFILPAVILGWHQNLVALTSWIEVMILPFITGGYVTPEHNNQSLPGLAARLLTNAPSYSTYLGNDYFPMRYDNLVAWSPATASWIVKACMGLFALLVIGCCRAPIFQPGMTVRHARQGWRLAVEYSIICIGMLLFSERTWKHHCVTLLLPYAVLCYGLATVEWTRTSKRIFGLVMVAATCLLYTTSTGLYGENPGRTADHVETASVVLGPAGLTAATQAGLFTDSIAKRAQVYGAYVWGFLLLLAGLTAQLRRAVSVPVATEEWKLRPYEILYPDGFRSHPTPARAPERSAKT